MRLYFDTSIMIHWVERGTPEFEERIVAKLRERAKQSPLLCWSDLTRLECRVQPLRRHDTGLLARYEDFFANPAAIRLPMTELVFDRAANLRAVHGLKTPDALHLSAAIEGGCDEFWTTDERLDKAAREYLRVMAF